MTQKKAAQHRVSKAASKKEVLPVTPSELKPLETQLLFSACDLSLLDFNTTDEISAITPIVDQSRAIEALQFGVDIKRQGYNLFVLGEPGSGRRAAVSRMLETKAASEPAPSDWCYVNNFDDTNKPRLLQLPQGRGAQLKRDMERFIEELAKAIPDAFENDEYRTQIEAIQEEFKQREQTVLRELGQESAKQSIALLHTQQGFTFALIKGEETLPPEEFEKLPDVDKEHFRKLTDEFGERLRKLTLQFPRWRREMQGRIKDISRNTLSWAAGHLIDELKEQHTDLANVQEFLDATMRDIVEVGSVMREIQKSDDESNDANESVLGGSISLLRYRVNLFIDNSNILCAPVVFEDNPTYANLIGRVDHVAHMGMLETDFTYIRSGALQRANGGYLVLEAAKVLSQSYAWEGLKRALRAEQVRIESLGQVLGLLSTLSLEPEPMPLQTKVVLVGERMHYYMLKEYDPEFAELFKIAADFDDVMPRSPENVRLYANFIATLTRGQSLDQPRRQPLRPLDRAAVARVIEHSARLAGDAEKLSGNTRQIIDLLQEADHYAGVAERTTVTRDDIEYALAAQIRRASRLRDLSHEQIQRKTILISVSGQHIGQINGLAVIDLGDFMFADPVRITATVRIGDGDVVDIEREADLGGAIHSKGVMILSAFLASRFAHNIPLSLSASLVFEQSYGLVEGDSASLAELCALMSAISGLPIKQSLATTGSVNQYGLVQPIGGVNEKIEGFFDICQSSPEGLSGEQGVLIPESNVKHLMLRADVVAACAAKKFHIYAVSDVDQAIELLTGVPIGKPDEKGFVPEGTVNYLVATQLVDLSTLRQAFSASSTRRSARKKKTDETETATEKDSVPDSDHAKEPPPDSPD